MPGAPRPVIKALTGNNWCSFKNCWLSNNRKENWILIMCRGGIPRCALKVRDGAGLIATTGIRWESLFSSWAKEDTKQKYKQKYSVYVGD